jgi:signal transduction histidine kinase/DNA-binding response OmpR family regulator
MQLYPLDIAFASLYLLDADGHEARRVACTASVHDDAWPAVLDLARALPGWPIDDLLRTGAEVALTPAAMQALEMPAPLWPERVRDGLLVPLKNANDGLAGWLVVGCSPRRPLDAGYRAFVGLVAGQIGSAVADAQAYEAERRRAQALAELDRAKTAFFSNVSHEFRTPLTLTLGPLGDAISDPRTPAPVREHLALAQRNAVRLQRLVNSLLDFSRIEAGRVAAAVRPTDLAALTRDVASTFRSAMQRAGLAFSVACEALPQPVQVDRDMWEKIVLNLLSNAFKFTLHGGVSVRLVADGRMARLDVVDTGAGIAPEQLPRIFERFHRIEGTPSRSLEGSGIGLALANELVKLHSGRMEVASQLGSGSTFTVCVPFDSVVPGHAGAAPSDASEDVGGMVSASARGFVEEALRWLPDEPAATPPRPATDDAVLVEDRRFAATFGARILLADDNADMRAYVSGLLATSYEVEAVADGEQALAAARRQRPDLVLSDVMMPRFDGFGLLAAVRGDERLRSVPVLLLSARAGEESRIEGLDAGADDYLVKPFSGRELLARVGAMLELRHMRSRVEDAYRLRTAQLETLVNAAPLGICLVDADLRFVAINPTAAPTFRTTENLEGTDFAALLHQLWPQPFADQVIGIFRHTLETGEFYEAREVCEQRKDTGAAEYYDWQVCRIPLSDGRFGVVCYFRNVAAQVHARHQLEAADRQKDEFLAMLAHELRNPLAPMRNAGEILARVAGDAAPVRQAVAIVQRQVENLTRLVDDLLDVSRITQGRVELRRRPVQVAELIMKGAEIADPLLRQKEHGLSVSMHGGALWVNGDPTRLVQCLGNLLSNAAKYTDPHGRIGLDVRERNGQAVISVSDNGVGIAAELQAHVFDLFVQADRSLDRSQGGLGIGLCVVKRLIDMHDGQVSVHSAGPGQGATFEIHLPLVAPQEPEQRPVESTTAVSRRILVVDDNEDAADSLSLMLGMSGHEVVCAYTAQQALERSAAFQPQVAFVDIGLPGMDGYELAGRLRQLLPPPELRLIALTGYGQAEDKRRAQEAGFEAYLVKPAPYEALCQLLKGACP